jgi:hypothetical protein
LTWLIGRQKWLKKEAVRRQSRTKIEETLVDLANKEIKMVKKDAVRRQRRTKTETLVDLAYK